MSITALRASTAPSVEIRGLKAKYEQRVAVRDVSLRCEGGAVTAIIGPSGCGKSTLLRCINRLHESVSGASVTGSIVVGDTEIYDRSVDPVMLRRRIGMVFQRPAPFPTLSVFDNVAAGLHAAHAGSGLPGGRRASRVAEPSVGASNAPSKAGASPPPPAYRARGRLSRTEIADGVERALRRASLWADVRDRLQGSAMSLSGGQQQRLCIARALAANPTVLLLDEPTASLDPLGTQRVEELLYELRSTVTVIVVTHNMQQAARISDTTAFLLDGSLVEHSPTRALFTGPADPRTESYITGRFG